MSNDIFSTPGGMNYDSQTRRLFALSSPNLVKRHKRSSTMNRAAVRRCAFVYLIVFFVCFKVVLDVLVSTRVSSSVTVVEHAVASVSLLQQIDASIAVADVSRTNQSTTATRLQRKAVSSETRQTARHPVTNKTDTSTTNQTETATTVPPSTASTPKYAYAYVIGGCDPERPTTYKGFLYNILISTRILRQEGSTADIVAFFQIAYQSPAETLAAEDIRLLQAVGIRIQYLPKTAHESFYEIMLDKFRILELVEYRRVLFMDGDIMPLTNLDYLFHLSEKGILKENVVVNGPWEPANGGFFMLTPAAGALDQIYDIIAKREEESRLLKGHKFDIVSGWGHEIKPPDRWETRKRVGSNWTFHGAIADQGLCKCVLSVQDVF